MDVLLDWGPVEYVPHILGHLQNIHQSDLWHPQYREEQQSNRFAINTQTRVEAEDEEREQKPTYNWRKW